MDRFLKNNAKASVKNFISSKEFVSKYLIHPQATYRKSKKVTIVFRE